MRKTPKHTFAAVLLTALTGLTACTIAPSDGDPQLNNVDPLKKRDGEYEYRREATNLNQPSATTPQGDKDAGSEGVTTVKDDQTEPPPPVEKKPTEGGAPLQGKLVVDANIGIFMDYLNLASFADAVDADQKTEVCRYQVAKLVLPDEPASPDNLNTLIATAFLPKGNKGPAAIQAKKAELAGLREAQRYEVTFTVSDPATGKISGSAKFKDKTFPLSPESTIRKTGEKYDFNIVFTEDAAKYAQFPAFIADLQHQPINEAHKVAGYDLHLLKRDRTYAQIRVLKGILDGNFQGRFGIYALNNDPQILNDMINCYFQSGGRLEDRAPKVAIEWTPPSTAASDPKQAQPNAAPPGKAGDGSPGVPPPVGDLSTGMTDVPTTGSGAEDLSDLEDADDNDPVGTVTDVSSRTLTPQDKALLEIADLTSSNPPQFVRTDDRASNFTVADIQRQCAGAEIPIAVQAPVRVKPADYPAPRMQRVQQRLEEISSGIAAENFVSSLERLAKKPRRLNFQLRGCYSQDASKPTHLFFHSSNKKSDFDINDSKALWQKLSPAMTRLAYVGDNRIAFRGNITTFLTTDMIAGMVCFPVPTNIPGFCKGVKKNVEKLPPRSNIQMFGYFLVQKDGTATKMEKLPKGTFFRRSAYLHVSTESNTKIRTDWDQDGREFTLSGPNREEHFYIPADERISLIGQMDTMEFSIADPVEG